MTDSFGRNIDYLRLSVTQRCGLNCLYCGSGCPDTDEMTVTEIRQAVEIFSLCGIKKVRLTGGEPLVRDDITEIAGEISNIDGIEKIALTTNGTGLKKYARDLIKAGVESVNISIDSLDRKNYELITGRDCLFQALDGLDEAQDAGMHIRINSVLIRGINDGEAENLINLARDRNIDVRFIELMPFSDYGRTEELRVRSEDILRHFPFLKPIDTDGKEKSVAKYYTADGFLGRIGLISPVSNKFCSECNRIRLLSNGLIKPCLGHTETFDLRSCLGDREQSVHTVENAIKSKPSGHNFGCINGDICAMNKIGG